MQQKRILGVFTLAMINVAAIISLRNLPVMVEYGFASILFYAVASLVFFIPTALVCAELATGWPCKGGLYRWVSEAFGKEVGFFTMWVSWMLSIAWFPTVLNFTAAAIAYMLDPSLIENKLFMITVILGVFWGATFINFLGLKTSGFISSFGAIFGTLIPGALIIGLGAIWVMLGKPFEIAYSYEALIPKFSLNELVFFAAVLLGLAGMEMSAFHAREAIRPQVTYPRAILISSFFILLISVLGSLSIALVVPQTEVSLFAGLLQAFTVFFAAFNMPWMAPVLAFMAVVGSLAGINTWILGPAKGILASAEDGFLPPFLQRMNNNDAPTGTLVFQAILASLLSLVVFFMPTTNSSYWIMTALTAIFAMIMYILIFMAAIKLRYSQPEVARHYKIPGGKLGMWIVAMLGIVSSLFAMFISFIPPAQIETGNDIFYMSYLFASVLAMCIPPLLFIRFKQPSWYHALD